MRTKEWQTINEDGKRRVIVTKSLPGSRWLEILTAADCRVEICSSPDILTVEEIQLAIGSRCDGAIGQLTEDWGDTLFETLSAAGGVAYSNYAVGYNNVDVSAATRHRIPVGNTPGVLTETTAEMAVALTLAAARRVSEADRFMRGGHYQGWLPSLLLGNLMNRSTVGVIGAGRIGAAYARMMVEGFKMNLVYFDPYPNQALEAYVAAYGQFLETQGEPTVKCTRLDSVEALLTEADVVSLHPVLNEKTHHLINRERLALMKEEAILVNASRGPVIDEAALIAHCQAHPEFRVGLDVFEDEPAMKSGLVDLDNVVLVPHIGSATKWTREGMAILAASNVAAILNGYGVWSDPNDILSFLGDNPPNAAPSIVNAQVIEQGKSDD